MKAFLNWRYYALTALFAATFLSAALIFGEDERPLGQWVVTRVCLAAFSCVCGFAFGRLSKKWECEGKVPEITNSKARQ